MINNLDALKKWFPVDLLKNLRKLHKETFGSLEVQKLRDNTGLDDFGPSFEFAWERYDTDTVVEDIVHYINSGLKNRRYSAAYFAKDPKFPTRFLIIEADEQGDIEFYYDISSKKWYKKVKPKTGYTEVKDLSDSLVDWYNSLYNSYIIYDDINAKKLKEYIDILILKVHKYIG